MGTQSKFFRAFVAGSTIYDGREITEEMIDDIVATFNPATYTPRCNVEHVTGYSPEPPFNGYGSVIAVKAQIDDIDVAGKTEKRKALYCQVDGNDQLTALASKDQKPFPSVEITPDYAGTGKFGLVGLAFTDRPASIGTQALKFSSRAPGTVFGTDPAATPLEFEPASDGAGIIGAISAGFSAIADKFAAGKEEPAKPKDPPVEKLEAANDNFSAFATAIGEAVVTAIKPLADAQAAMKADFTALKTQLASTEPTHSFSRPPATGGGGQFATDC